MSLPNGYTRLEYVETNTTQYIDTGFTANEKTRLVMDFKATPEALTVEDSTSLVVANGSFLSKAFNAYSFGASGQGLWSFGNSWNTFAGVSYENRITLDMNREVYSMRASDGTVVSFTHTISASFTSKHTVRLFGSDTTSYYGMAAKIYYCRIYDDDVLVRDLVPCLAPSGTAGLYDLVNGVFYDVAEGDPLIAGPILIVIPDPPGYLTAESDNGTNTLTWDASADADGYRVYINGVLTADTQQTSLTFESEPYSVNICYVTAYNGDGESDPAVIRIFTAGKKDVLDDLITDRTETDVIQRTKKGVYNAFDINRVSVAAHRVRTVLAPLGYSTPEVSDYRWAANEIPRAEEMAAHHASVIGQDVINYSKNKVILPLSLSRLTYNGANNIEKFLRLCGEAAERIPEAYIYSDEIFGGES